MVKVLARAGVVVLLPAARPATQLFVLGHRRTGAVIPMRAALAQRQLLELQPSADIPNRRRSEWLSQQGKGLFPFFH
jgi:hypothetical protein